MTQEVTTPIRLKSIPIDSGQIAIMSSEALDPLALQEALRNNIAFCVTVNSSAEFFPVMIRKDESGVAFEAALDLLGDGNITSPFAVLHEQVGAITTKSAKFIICDPCHVVGGDFFDSAFISSDYNHEDELDATNRDTASAELNEDEYEKACIISSTPNGHGPFLKNKGYVFAVDGVDECSLRTEPVGNTVGIICISIAP